MAWSAVRGREAPVVVAAAPASEPVDTSAGEPENEPAPPTPEPATTLPPAAREAVSALADPVPADPPPDAAPAVAAVNRRCATLGPFSKPPRATLAADALRDLGGTVTERREAGRIWVGHWVHLSPAASREAAVEVVEKLRADGVSDIYIEPSEPLRNAISLGLFSDASRAETRAGKIRALGVRPQIRDRFREGERIFLDVSLPESATFDAGRFQLGPIPLAMTDRACPGAS
ncbi:MAG: hypothetical protein AAFU65_13180 [Pseudomonadota bacterium]